MRSISTTSCFLLTNSKTLVTLTGSAANGGVVEGKLRGIRHICDTGITAFSLDKANLQQRYSSRRFMSAVYQCVVTTCFTRISKGKLNWRSDYPSWTLRWNWGREISLDHNSMSRQSRIQTLSDFMSNCFSLLNSQFASTAHYSLLIN